MFASIHTAQLALRRVHSGAPGGSFFARLRTARALHQQRRALAQLDDNLLADIGLTRHQALSEASLSVWDVPDTWRR